MQNPSAPPQALLLKPTTAVAASGRSEVPSRPTAGRIAAKTTALARWGDAIIQRVKKQTRGERSKHRRSFSEKKCRRGQQHKAFLTDLAPQNREWNTRGDPVQTLNANRHGLMVLLGSHIVSAVSRGSVAALNQRILSRAPEDLDSATFRAVELHYGRLIPSLEAPGIPMGLHDRGITPALAQNLTLVSHNTREFERMAGLILEKGVTP